MAGITERVRKGVVAITCLVVCSGVGQSQAQSGSQSDYLRHETDPDWDVTKPRGATRTVDFETTEGTWMSVDASADGRWLVFDLMGHIYRLAANGGRAECLTQNSGLALNYHPRFSPDGKRIAFISDRAGQANLWIMNADGSDVKPVFLDPVSRMVSPAWMPDGSAILAVREFPTYSMHRRSARIWRFPVDRPEEAAEQLVGAKSGFQAYWPSPSPDGKSFYFMWATFAEPLTGYVHQQHLRRYEFATRSQSLVTLRFGERGYHPGTNADLAPEASPDGRWVAFARRVQGGAILYRGHQYDARTALWLRELSTGQEHILLDPITLDMQGAHGMKNLAVLPGYSWNKDSQSLVVWTDGKLRRVDLSGAVHDIPFVAQVHRVVSEQARWNHGVGGDTLQSQNIRWPALSEPNHLLIFEALGEIWQAPVRDKQAKAKTLVSWSPQAAYYMPAISPDGRRVAFVSWSDYSLGNVFTCELPECRPNAVTRSPGLYLYPVWSRSGETLYALKARSTNIVSIAAEGGQLQQFDLLELGAAGARVIRENVPASQISVGPSGRLYGLSQSGLVDTQVYLTEGKTFPAASANLTSLDPQKAAALIPEAGFPRASSAVIAPDGRRVAFIEDSEAYAAPLSKSTAEYAHGEENDWEGPQRPFFIVKDDAANGALPLSFGGANTLRWVDSHRVIYALGQKVHIYDTSTRQDRVITVEATVPRAIPTSKQTVALRGARIITLGKAAVIESGSIIVRGARITCVGTCSAAGADKVYDLTGKTITAGFTDVHAHGEWPSFPVYRQHYAPAALYLAYGVTTTLDPAVDSEGVFPVAELIEAGRMVGPRSYSTGEAILPMAPGTGPQNYRDAEAIVRRIADQGGHSIKIFLTPRRDQRQMLADVARHLGLSVTNEGQDLAYDAGTAMDGDTGWEHMLHYQAIFRDGIEFFAQTKSVYSPTLVVAGAGLWSEEYWQARTDFMHDAKLQRFLPWPELVRRLGAPIRPKTQYPFPLHAEAVKDLRRAGGFASLGGHGEQWGLDTHWEMWNYAEAQTPLEVLTMASQGGARMMGLENDIGSIEVGKLADLVIMNSNPLQNIQNTTDIQYVMKAGTLYDAATLDELWPTARAYGAPPWKGGEPYATDVKTLPD